MKEKILTWLDSFLRLPVIGLDISDRSAKYVKFVPGKRVAVDFFGEIEIPKGIVADGEIKNEDALAGILKDKLARRGRSVTASFFAVSLPEEKSFLRVIQLPKVKRDDVGNAVRWEIETNIPLPPEDLVYDYEIIEPLEDHLDHVDVVVTAFPRAFVDSYLRVLKRAGLHPVALELELQAVARSSLPVLRERSAKIIVDIGRYRTGFVVFSGGTILFTATAPLGGKTFEDHIAKAFDVSPEKAEMMKKEIGLDKKAHEGNMFLALVPAVSLVADELRRALEYYQSRHGGGHLHGASASVESILLVGGDAGLRGLDTYLASVLKVPVEYADPFAGIRDRLIHAVPPIPLRRARGFATAIGLALRGIRE